MTPTLLPDQFVLVDPDRVPGSGDLALARHPHRPELLIVKRVGEVTADGQFVLVSDNPSAGTDSRTWGPLAPESIEGTVTMMMGGAPAR